MLVKVVDNFSGLLVNSGSFQNELSVKGEETNFYLNIFILSLILPEFPSTSINLLTKNSNADPFVLGPPLAAKIKWYIHFSYERIP
uniref:Uncharacterized protein n=1 Tax=Romanomermis culicivorax TaxID=13658 RepID=A0A915JUC3_ROMCU